MSYCKVCLKDDCETTHTPEEVKESQAKADSLKEALRKIVEYAKILEGE